MCVYKRVGFTLSHGATDQSRRRARVAPSPQAGRPRLLRRLRLLRPRGHLRRPRPHYPRAPHRRGR